MTISKVLVAAGFVLLPGCTSISATPIDLDASLDPLADATAPKDAGKTLDAGDAAIPDPFAGCTRDPGATAVTFDAGAGTNPIDPANFTMAMALAGFPAGSGTLTAVITTEKSTISCQLADQAAPTTVANFIGLARGTRPFQDQRLNNWKTAHFYDGLIWHRVIPGFVIQGGDPSGDGTGGPGYDLPIENHVVEPLGTLAMAAGSTPSGSQFYIVVGTGPMADYNVFGTCSTAAAIEIANVDRDSNDKPRMAVHMQKIEIARCP